VRAVALVAVVVGAAGSIGLMLYVGRRNPSSMLLVLFAIWVLSPFVGLALAASGSARWFVAARERVHVVMLIVAMGSLAIYGQVAFGPPRPRPAAAFLLVPFGSWGLIVANLGMAALRSGKPSDRRG
jgi:tryptophan-rich sensory protein